MKLNQKDKAHLKIALSEKEHLIYVDQLVYKKNTMMSQKVNIAHLKKERELHRQDLEPKYAITFVPKQTFHAHLHQLLIVLFAEILFIYI